MPSGMDAVRRISRSSYWRAEDAKVIVEAWRVSGTSVAAFARLHRLSAKRIMRWTKRLADDDAPSVRFHRVRVVAPTAAASATPPLTLDTPPTIEIVVHDELRVRVPPGADPVELRRILDVVRDHDRC